MTRRSLPISVTAICILTLILSVGTAQRTFAGASFIVNSTTDAVDATPGDGACATLAGQCTLRAAIQETNALPGADSVTIPAGTYALTIPGPAEDAALTGDLDIRDALTLTGAGAAKTIVDGNQLDRVFEVRDNAVADISGITVQNGSEVGSLGAGGIAVNLGSSMTLSKSVVTNNKTTAFGGGVGTIGMGVTIIDSSIRNNRSVANGGGIGSIGPVTLIRTEVSNNASEQGVGGMACCAGGDTNIADSTFSGNTSGGGQGGGGLGLAGTTANVINTTFSSNSTNGAEGGGAILAVAGVTLNLQGSRITGNSSASKAGGVYSEGTATISESVIQGNAANPDSGLGGGTYNLGSMTVTKSTVSGNTAFLLGGLGSINALTVTDTKITGNSVKGFGETFAGAGIGVLSGSLTVSNSTISGNSTPNGAPGGIGVLGDATISGSTISNNSAGGALFGGGIAHANGTLDVTDSTISGNSSAGFGGGLAAGGRATLRNVTISGNSAAADGGGIAATGTTALNNVTITNNTSDSNGDGVGDGGGVSTVADPVTMSNTIIAGNVDRGGEQPDCNKNGLIASQGYNLVQNTAGCPYVSGPGDITGQPARLGPLANNGGSTQTHALLGNSPAIDAGNPSAPAGSPTCEKTDQRGVTRPQDGNGDGLLRCDIGAFERRAGTTDSAGITEVPVAFRVVNSDTSGFSCPSDSKEYTVRGHLVGPAVALASTSPAVTFYLYGFEGGEFHWRMTEELAGMSGYDWPLEMAKLGHVSLTIDMLGYDSSVTPEGPHGFLNCWGSQADVAHQIVGQLKNGQYSVDGGSGNGISFAKVILAGHDAGATVAEIEAYSYKDIDGLMTVEMADQGFSQYILNLFAEEVAFCATTGGEDREKESDPPVGPGGYFHLPPLDDWKTVLFQMDNSDERVVDAAIALRNRNPCAWELTAAGAFPVNRARLQEVDVPVLLVFPEKDPIFTRDGQEQQRGNYCPEPAPLTNCDVEAQLLAGTGHFPMLEKTAPQFRALVADWLCSRGLVSAPRGDANGACG